MLSPEQILARALAGHGQAALADYRTLMALLPQEPAPIFNSAALTGSVDLLRRCLRLAPDLAPAHCMLGDFRRAWILDPASAETANNFANQLSQSDEPEAIVFYRHALHILPARPETYGNLAACLLAQHRPRESLLAARSAAVLAPGNGEIWNNLGNALYELRDYAGALAAFHHARRVAPAFAKACLNEGGLRLDLGEAETMSRLALVLAPDWAACYNNLANGELLACRLDSADRIFRRARQLSDDPQTRFNHAAVLLKQGRMREGWEAYEARRLTPAALRRRRADDPPDWQGGDPRGRTLLLSAEQGYGDALQFCRFAPWLAARGTTVILRTHAALVRLMGSLDGVSQVIGPDQTAEADFHLPLMSVPAAFGEIPAAVPYLSAEPWRRDLPGRKIGLVWSGDPRPGQRSAHLLDRRRSMTLEHFAFLRGLPDISLVSLQKGLPAPGLIDWTAEFEDFADTAGLIAALDLVISVDTSVAHLAGAMGKPVWILSRFDGCWRWLEGRSDSPWYPTARLFRQTRPGDWSGPLDEIESALRSG